MLQLRGLEVQEGETPADVLLQEGAVFAHPTATMANPSDSDVTHADVPIAFEIKQWTLGTEPPKSITLFDGRSEMFETRRDRTLDFASSARPLAHWKLVLEHPSSVGATNERYTLEICKKGQRARA